MAAAVEAIDAVDDNGGTGLGICRGRAERGPPGRRPVRPHERGRRHRRRRQHRLRIALVTDAGNSRRRSKRLLPAKPPKTRSRLPRRWRERPISCRSSRVRIGQSNPRRAPSSSRAIPIRSSRRMRTPSRPPPAPKRSGIMSSAPAQAVRANGRRGAFLRKRPRRRHFGGHRDRAAGRRQYREAEPSPSDAEPAQPVECASP